MKSTLTPIEDREHSNKFTKRLDQIVEEIIHSNENIFYTYRGSQYTRKDQLRCKYPAMFNFIKNDIMQEMNLSLPIDKINPYVELFVINRARLLNEGADINNFINGYVYDVLKTLGSLNAFIDSIQREARSKEFKEAVNQYYRQPNANYNNLMGDINKQFDGHSRLLVIRLDLEYRQDCDNQYLTHNELYDKYDQAVDDREHLFRNMRSNNLFDHMLGYAWKLELGRSTGFHYHLLFFFDGRYVRQDGTKAAMIGEYWNNVITQGRGRYFNCNAQKSRYDYCGIGNIRNTDIEARIGLERALAYITKPDTYLYSKIALPDNGRSFGRTKLLPQITRGRPRTLGYPDTRFCAAI